jgi:hypothetical protein
MLCSTIFRTRFATPDGTPISTDPMQGHSAIGPTMYRDDRETVKSTPQVIYDILSRNSKPCFANLDLAASRPCAEPLGRRTTA